MYCYNGMKIFLNSDCMECGTVKSQGNFVDVTLSVYYPQNGSHGTTYDIKRIKIARHCKMIHEKENNCYQMHPFLEMLRE